MSSTKKTDKAKKFEIEGDKLVSKGKLKKAMEKYRKALEHNPNLTKVYDKLADLLDQMPGEWKIEDFVESVSCTMKKQEIDEPIIRQVHARLSPEWKKISDLAVKILIANDKDKELPCLIDELLSHKEIGTRILIEVVRQTIRQKPEKDDRSKEA